VRTRIAVVLGVCCLLWTVEARAFDDFEDLEDSDSGDSTEEFFVINGFIQNQTGIFFSTESNKWEQVKDDFGNITEYPIDHGDKLGKLSMMRTTLQLEADLKPAKGVRLRGVFRGVRSLQLEVDEYAQPPDPGKTGGDYVAWVNEKYYTENRLREIFIDIEAAPWLDLRIGRQQVAWGDMGQYRLLDVVNPTNSTWHFPTLENYDDTRVPLWMFKSVMEIKPLNGSLEFIWLPLLDNPEETVTVPLTFVSAWGLPRSPKQEYESGFNIRKKTPRYPGHKIEDSRLGARWVGSLGVLSYSLVYYWTHQITPPIPTGFVQLYDPTRGALEVDRSTGNAVIDEVFLDYPRQHIAGFSLEYAFQSPVSTIVRLEASYTPNATYPAVSSAEKTTPDYVDGQDLYTSLLTYEKHVASWGIQLMRPTFIRFLNPTQTFMFVAQALHTMVLDWDSKERYLDIPNLDSTETKQHSLTLVGAVTTSYLHGMLAPKIVGAYIPGPAPSGFVTAQMAMLFGNHWRAAVGATMFFGEDPYKGLGLFRDRDEVFARLQYQF